MKIQIMKLHDDVKIPSRVSYGSAGFDLRAYLMHPINIPPLKSMLIPTGLKIFIDNPSVGAFLIPKSGLGHKHGVVLGNGTGLIDSDYQGEIMVSVLNRNNTGVLKIEHLSPLAQMYFTPILLPEFVEVESFTSSTERGESGFGEMTQLTLDL